MEEEKEPKDYYLIQGMIFAAVEEYRVTTVLGSCVTICLWDPYLEIGGINHYMYPFWNGEGLATPRYGNIAIPKLIEKMLSLGCTKNSLRAKVFGGGNILPISSNGTAGVGARNIILAEEMLSDEGVPVIAVDVAGNCGRKIKFNTKTGVVMLRRLITEIRQQP